MMRKIRLGNLRPKWLLLFTLILAAAVVLGACSSGVSESRVDDLETDIDGVKQDVSDVKSQLQTLAPKVGKVAESTTERHFYVTGVEWKGSTSINDLAPPSLDPATLSDGYGYKGPGVYDASNPDKWQVATYVWSPASMVAYEGDKVTLTIFILNGNTHSTWVEDPNGGEATSEVEMNRGREYEVSFTAGEPGVYVLHCDEHDPTMTGYILVLPRA